MSIEIETRSTERALTDTLQLALRDGLPLATNNVDLRKTLARTGGLLA